MSEPAYKACFTSSPDPIHGVEGPGRGLGYSAWYLYPENTFASLEDAEKCARLMSLAFEEGQKARSGELRALLGAQ